MIFQVKTCYLIDIFTKLFFQFLTEQMYTLEERVFIVEHVLREGDRYNQTVKDLFRKRFPKKLLPHRDSVRDMIKRFRTTGSVLDQHRSGRPKKKENDTPAKSQSVKTRSKAATVTLRPKNDNVELVIDDDQQRQQAHLASVSTQLSTTDTRETPT